jgi:hypothetical protein
MSGVIRCCTYIALALPVCEQHESDRAEHADPHHPLVALNPSFVRVREEADRAQGGREEELQGEDGIDLSNKLHANRKGCFCDGAAELENVSLVSHAEEVLDRHTLKSSGTLSSSDLASPGTGSAWYEGGGWL